MAERVHIYHRTPSRCPACGAPVRLRWTPEGKKALAKALASSELRDDVVVETYQCARRLKDGSLCNHRVDIKVRDWREIG